MSWISRVAIAIAASLLVLPGCNHSETPPPANPSNAAEAGPNKRLKVDEKYKKMLDKNGRPLWKPGQKPPGQLPGGRAG